MTKVVKVVSLISLALVLVPSMMYFAGMLAHDTVRSLAVVGTLMWFAATPMWMGRELPVDATHVEI
ncbi:MAG: hypothetical protein D6753_01615 [Planctomycetota bacterium]|nr:MAG: hypothetical protein D6753_01615 [Planctomycetota bacterium]